jgi:hypothetical protein
MEQCFLAMPLDPTPAIRRANEAANGPTRKTKTGWELRLPSSRVFGNCGDDGCG